MKFWGGRRGTERQDEAGWAASFRTCLISVSPVCHLSLDLSGEREGHVFQ